LPVFFFVLPTPGEKNLNLVTHLKPSAELYETLTIKIQGTSKEHWGGR
jgi:hypothetical protein